MPQIRRTPFISAWREFLSAQPVTSHDTGNTAARDWPTCRRISRDARARRDALGKPSRDDILTTLRGRARA